MRKRGQFTIFVILGITLLIVFAFAFYLASLFTSTVPNIDQEINSFTKSIHPLVTDCLGLVTAEAVQKMGAQGGDLYDVYDVSKCTPPGTGCLWVERTNTATQPSGTAGLDYLPYENPQGTFYYVSYGIKRNTNPPQTFKWDDLNYPESGYTLQTLALKQYFGDNTLRKLCDTEGENRQRPGFLLSCSGSSYDWVYPQAIKNLSVQEQLEHYVETHIPGCAKLSQYAIRGLTFTVGDPVVNITLGDSDVTAALYYPVSFQAARGKQQSRTLSYTTKLNVRLKKVYEYANRLIEKDIQDLNFDLRPTSNDFQDAALGYDSRFNLHRYADVCISCQPVTFTDLNSNPLVDLCPATPNGCDVAKDDIIEITDGASLIAGQEFMFRFAVQNRRPVLDKIGQQSFTTICPNPGTCTGVITLTAIDPDDESLTFSSFLAHWTVTTSNPTIATNKYSTTATRNIPAPTALIWNIFKVYDSSPNSFDFERVDYQCVCSP